MITKSNTSNNLINQCQWNLIPGWSSKQFISDSYSINDVSGIDSDRLSLKMTCWIHVFQIYSRRTLNSKTHLFLLISCLLSLLNYILSNTRQALLSMRRKSLIHIGRDELPKDHNCLYRFELRICINGHQTRIQWTNNFI